MVNHSHTLFRSFRFQFAQHSQATRPSHGKDCRERSYAFGSRLALQCRGSRVIDHFDQLGFDEKRSSIPLSSEYGTNKTVKARF